MPFIREQTEQERRARERYRPLENAIFWGVLKAGAVLLVLVVLVRLLLSATNL
jgi:hypothetical protein